MTQEKLIIVVDVPAGVNGDILERVILTTTTKGRARIELNEDLPLAIIQRIIEALIPEGATVKELQLTPKLHQRYLAARVK